MIDLYAETTGRLPDLEARWFEDGAEEEEEDEDGTWHCRVHVWHRCGEREIAPIYPVNLT